VRAGRISFEGRVVIVTGAGRGLGRAYALELARRGARLLLNSTGETAEAVAREARALGGVAVAHAGSVAEPGVGAHLVETAVCELGRLDAVIANAGTVLNAPFEETTDDQLDDLYAVHLRGAFALVRAAFPELRVRGGGRVVLTSSASGVFGLPGQAAYGAVKAALVGLCNVVALEGREAGIHVNAVLPMAFTNPGRTASTARLRELLGERAPAMSAEHVAGLVTYLASDACAVSGRAFSAVAGRLAEVVTGVGAGWLGPVDPSASAEDVAAQLGTITARGGLLFPGALVDEVEAVARAAHAEGRSART
jgi:NAD(P)-dependent dehydrogenase (short-subunit alcohol dehydrogenase family)